MRYYFFFFNDTATTEIYTLSLHDALPICHHGAALRDHADRGPRGISLLRVDIHRSEEHTSELQSRLHLVCRLLLEKKNQSVPSPACRPIRSLVSTAFTSSPLAHYLGCFSV